MVFREPYFQEVTMVFQRFMAVAVAVTVGAVGASGAHTAEVSVKMYLTAEKGQGKYVGKVYFKDDPKGLIVKPRLKGLAPGDLPVLSVGKDGAATGTLSAPRLKVADLKKRSLMIHAGGDNFSDAPKPLGGGGARLACGLF
jgi:Cu-Zn family superoxide dismutase